MMETLNVRAYCRYMDDIIWWCRTPDEAKATLNLAQAYLHKQKQLSVKSSAKISLSRKGTQYCGYEVRQGVIHPSRRKRQSYKWQVVNSLDDYQANKITELQLQRSLNQAQAVLAHTEAKTWQQHVLACAGLR